MGEKKLIGKVAMITGGARGLGRGLCAAFGRIRGRYCYCG